MPQRLSTIGVSNAIHHSADAAKGHYRLTIIAGPNSNPERHFKFPHLWTLKFPQAGRAKY